MKFFKKYKFLSNSAIFPKLVYFLLLIYLYIILLTAEREKGEK